MSRLITTKASKAEATADGPCGTFVGRHMFQVLVPHGRGEMPKFAPTEIERVDLATFALDLAQWETNELIWPC